MRSARGGESMADTIARVRTVVAEIDALYALRAAAEEAIRLDSVAPLKGALAKLSIAEKVRRGAP